MAMSDETYVGSYKLLFEAMLKGGVESIVKAGSKIFASPVALTDENYRLICQFPNEPIGDPVWDTLLKEHTLPLETIWHYQTSFLNGKTSTYKPFYADWGPARDMPRIFGELYHGNQLFGHLGIFLGSRPLAEGDLESAELLINALNIEVRSKLGNGRWQSTPSAYLQDMLSADSPAQVKNLAERNLHKSVLSDVALLVTPIGENTANKSFAACAVTELSLRYRHIISVIHDDSIVTLIGELNSSEFHPAESSFIKRIVSFLAEHNMVSGISDCFHNLYEIPAHYKQALLTAKLAAKKGDASLGVYRDYAPMHMFLELSEGDAPEAYIHPVLEQMRQYDRLQNTEYFKTLRTFSMTMHNKDSAAVHLSIHRNTLLYRLNRIKDLFDVSYEDEKTALHLLTSFLLLDVMG